jgi:hypothetical protein
MVSMYILTSEQRFKSTHVLACGVGLQYEGNHLLRHRPALHRSSLVGFLNVSFVWCQFSIHAMRDFQPINPRHRVVSILLTTSPLGTTSQGMEYLTHSLEIVSCVEANR